jgi:hypothetical protein
MTTSKAGFGAGSRKTGIWELDGPLNIVKTQYLVVASP